MLKNWFNHKHLIARQTKTKQTKTNILLSDCWLQISVCIPLKRIIGITDL